MKNNILKATKSNYVSTRNACKVCTPLGASLAFMGVDRAIPVLHGSQGCATYIRRYMISHFKEPVDIASSSFTEDTAVFGGEKNLFTALTNVTEQYEPEVIGLATTCLSETIGDDVKMFLNRYRSYMREESMPHIVPVSTASYRGTHIDGFHSTVLALTEYFAKKSDSDVTGINLFSGMLSPADLRVLKEVVSSFKLDFTLLPDYSERLDGGGWEKYEKIPKGGTTVEQMTLSGSRKASIEFGRILAGQDMTAGKFLAKSMGIELHSLGLPVGIKETDKFFEVLEDITGEVRSEKYIKERMRLVDAYADGHKYVFEKRVLLYGEEDFVVSMASFLGEIGMVPVIIASGGESGRLEKTINEVYPFCERYGIEVFEGFDFADMDDLLDGRDDIDMILGNSKGYKTAKRYDVPIVRIGFPIHDRFGGQRIKHVSYEGTQILFDRIVNTMIDVKQSSNDVGYTYI